MRRRRIRVQSIVIPGAQVCPDCGGPLIYAQGCVGCPLCGYSACG
jgi:hypothetical protein